MSEKYSSDDIQALSLGEAIRKRPRLYFDKCFEEKCLDALPFEVLCHAFDEYFDGACNRINISVSRDMFTVTYNAGMDVEINSNGLSRAEMIMTHLYACKNEKKHLAVGEAFCQLGMAIINLASEKCELTTVSKGKRGTFVFEHGITRSTTINDEVNENDFTEICMKPGKLVFEQLGFTAEGLQEKASQVRAKLPGLDISIHYNSETISA